MIVLQADMWDPEAAAENPWCTTRTPRTHSPGSRSTFRKPVVLVTGDSHSFEIDKPLTDAATTNAAGGDGPNVIQNFTRVTTFGDYQLHWVSATINPKDPTSSACTSTSSRRSSSRTPPGP